MNNDRLPAWNKGKVLTINCKSTLWGLRVSCMNETTGDVGHIKFLSSMLYEKLTTSPVALH